MKVLLAGSPAITLPAFEAIIKNFEVVGLITQPDRPQGRGMVKTPTPASLLAKKYDIKVFKPQKIGEIKAELAALDFDILVTFAFGQYIPSFLLAMGKFLPVNIHGSLLPKYRGAAPIHHAILNGDQEIGITLMEMVQAMDAGDMLFQAKQKIDAQTTTGMAMEIIAKLAANHIGKWLTQIFKGEFKKTPQSKKFTLAPKITKDFALLEKHLTFDQALRKVRALNPSPGAFMIIDQKRLKIFNLVKEKHLQAIPLILADGPCYATDFQWAGKKRVIL